jgi:integrase
MSKNASDSAPADNRRLIQVFNSKHEKLPYLFERDGRYYVYCQFQRKRYSRLIANISEIGQGDAARRAAKMVKMIKEARWMALDGVLTRRTVVYSTLDTLFTAYRNVAHRRGNPAADTVERNILALKLILSKALGREVSEATESDILSDKILADYAKHALEDKAGIDRDRAQRSIVSFIRQARSIFSKKMRFDPEYKALTLPNLDGFMTYMPVEAAKYQYEMPPESLYKPTLEAARKLKDSKPHLYMVHLLVYDLGLRANEAACSRWNWIEHEDGPAGKTWRMSVKDRPEEDFHVKGRSGSVPVPAKVLEHLQAGHREGDPYIVPGGTNTARRDLIQREYSAWLRKIGWKTQKAAHEMRKLRGCFWRHKYGLDRAHDWLRHSSYQTTLDYYAALPRRNEPASLDDSDYGRIS